MKVITYTKQISSYERTYYSIRIGDRKSEMWNILPSVTYHILKLIELKFPYSALKSYPAGQMILTLISEENDD